MLCLSRVAGEEIRIGDSIVIRVNRVSGGRVSIGIEAPKEIPITRGELVSKPMPIVNMPSVPGGMRFVS